MSSTKTKNVKLVLNFDEYSNVQLLAHKFNENLALRLIIILPIINLIIIRQNLTEKHNDVKQAGLIVSNVYVCERKDVTSSSATLTVTCLFAAPDRPALNEQERQPKTVLATQASEIFNATENAFIMTE